MLTQLGPNLVHLGEIYFNIDYVRTIAPVMAVASTRDIQNEQGLLRVANITQLTAYYF